MNLTEFSKHTGKSRTTFKVRRGFVDLLASSMECYYGLPLPASCAGLSIADAWAMEGFAVVNPPQFLQRGIGSCIHEATESAAPQLFSQSVRDLCTLGVFMLAAVKLSTFVHRTDGGSLNQLKTRWTSRTCWT